MPSAPSSSVLLLQPSDRQKIDENAAPEFALCHVVPSASLALMGIVIVTRMGLFVPRQAALTLVQQLATPAFGIEVVESVVGGCEGLH